MVISDLVRSGTCGVVDHLQIHIDIKRLGYGEKLFYPLETGRLWVIFIFISIPNIKVTKFLLFFLAHSIRPNRGKISLFFFLLAHSRVRSLHEK
jgi:hypothetical protein